MAQSPEPLLSDTRLTIHYSTHLRYRLVNQLSLDFQRKVAVILNRKQK